jgi:polar amino acid transport system substrate-binding protein
MMMSAMRVCAVLGLAAMLLSGAPARAEPVTLFGNSEQPPKAWLDHGTPRGFGIDTAVEVLKRAGFEPSVSLLPYARALEEVKQGGIMTGVFKSDDGARFYDYSDPVVYEEVVMVVRMGKDFPFTSVADLRGKKVGMQVAFFYGSEFDAMLPQLATEADASPSTRLKKLAAGRIDVALLNPGRASVANSATDGGVLLDELTVLPKPLARLANHLVIGKGMPGGADILGRINRAIAAATSDDTLAKIMDSYGQ